MTSDKSYAVEARLNAYIAAMSGLSSVGHQSSMLTANAATCNSTSQVSTGLSVAVISGAQYTFFADLYVSYIQASGQLIYLTMAGPTCSAFHCKIQRMDFFSNVVASATDDTTSQTTMGSNTGLGFTPSATGGSGYWVHLQGYMTTTSAANLTVNQATSAAGSAFTVNQGSGLWVFAV